MNSLILTGHAAMRMAQRSIKYRDAELIALIGTEVHDGYLVRVKDYQEVDRQLKLLLDRLRRIVGKRLIVADGKIVTAYHTSRNFQRRLLRNSRKSGLHE